MSKFKNLKIGTKVRTKDKEYNIAYITNITQRKGWYWYDIRIVDGGGEKTCYPENILEVLK